MHQTTPDDFPEKQIVKVVICQGSERTLAPPTNMHQQEAPFRKPLLLRRDGSLQYEKNWERWTHSAQRQLACPAHASRLNITVFAKKLGTRETHLPDNAGPSSPVPSNNHANTEPAGDLPVPASVDANSEPQRVMRAATVANKAFRGGNRRVSKSNNIRCK